MIIEISIAVIAVAFVILVIYIIIMTKDLRITLKEVNQTLMEARKQLDEVGGQAKHVMEHTNQISFELKQKIGALDSFFNALTQVGEIFKHKISTLKKESVISSHEEEIKNLYSTKSEHELRFYELIKIADILELAGIGIRLWQKIKKRR